MTVQLYVRTGIGLDIEFNDDICHIVSFGEENDETVVGFMGVIIKLPFFSLYIGDFFDLEG